MLGPVGSMPQYDGEEVLVEQLAEAGVGDLVHQAPPLKVFPHVWTSVSACHGPTMMTPMLSRTFRPTLPVDIRLTLGPLARGSGDPTMKFRLDGVWRATRTPDGPATTRISSDGRAVTVVGWGPGAAWALDAAPALLGEGDDDRAFVAHHQLIDDAHRRHPGLRIARSQAVIEALVPTVLEQKVVGKSARRSWAALVRRYSEPAPGPVGKMLWLPPAPARLAALSADAFHPLNVEHKRANTIRLACNNAAALEAGAGDDDRAARRGRRGRTRRSAWLHWATPTRCRSATSTSRTS